MMMSALESINDLNAARALIASLHLELSKRDEHLRQRDALLVDKDRQIKLKQTLIDKLTQEIAIYKRLQFGKKSEQFQGEQGKLLLETIDTDMAAIEVELAALRAPAPKPNPERKIPRRAKLPADLPRVDIRHDLESSACPCGCPMRHIGDDVSEKLDYAPGQFTVERHIRPKWVCQSC
jgi:hypothetical protein